MGRPCLTARDRLERNEAIELGVMRCDPADLVRYAGASGDFNPLHWDPIHAQRAGFADVIVHGMLSMAVAARLLSGLLERPTDLISLKVRFRNELMVRETAVVWARLSSRAAGRLKLTLWAEAERDGVTVRPIDIGEATIERGRREGAEARHADNEDS